MSRGARELVRDLLAIADIRVGGERPFDIEVLDERTYAAVVARGSLGLGESYVDGWWECEALDQFADRVLRADLSSRLPRDLTTLALGLRARLRNLQTRARARVVARQHYDLGNDLFQAMLDRRLVYSCALWEDARTLDEAQEAKLDLICRKLELEPGMRLLDVGCGFGSLLRYAAENYGVRGIGITLSERQRTLARQLCAGLPIEILLEDYRDHDGEYARVASVGMLEHVGPKNYQAFAHKLGGWLRAPGGIAVLHTICNNRDDLSADPWIEHHVFPNGMTPSLSRLIRSLEPELVLEDVHNLGPHYDPTLCAWHRNFERAWPVLRDRYGERFHRTWRYYLLMCAGNFRSRSAQVHQLVLSPPGRPQPRHCRRPESSRAYAMA